MSNPLIFCKMAKPSRRSNARKSGGGDPAGKTGEKKSKLKSGFTAR